MLHYNCRGYNFFGSSAVMAEEQDGEDLSGELISGYSELYGEQIEAAPVK